MITKGIIEEVISPYKYRVRLPIYDQIKSSSTATPTNLLPIASLCGLPNTSYNFYVGDIVYVADENNERDNLVILGSFIKDNDSKHGADLSAEFINIGTSAQLPEDTTIGNVKSGELAGLIGLHDNIQQQIDYLQDKIDSLQVALNNIN